MNGFLWLGVASMLVLLAAVVLDGFDDAVDIFDLGADWLSLPAVVAFIGAFGFGAGAFWDALGPLAIVPGLTSGALFGWGAVRLGRAALHMPTDATETAAGLLGSVGRVVTPPDAGRFGEVLLSRPTGPVKVACTADGPIHAGTEVVVIEVSSSTLVAVAPLGLDTADAPALDA